MVTIHQFVSDIISSNGTQWKEKTVQLVFILSTHGIILFSCVHKGNTVNSSNINIYVTWVKLNFSPELLSFHWMYDLKIWPCNVIYQCHLNVMTEQQPDIGRVRGGPRSVFALRGLSAMSHRFQRLICPDLPRSIRDGGQRRTSWNTSINMHWIATRLHMQGLCEELQRS